MLWWLEGSHKKNNSKLFCYTIPLSLQQYVIWGHIVIHINEIMSELITVFFFFKKAPYCLTHKQVFFETLGMPLIEARLWTPVAK
jgi:hypothetical protein